MDIRLLTHFPIFVVLLAACASFDGRGLIAGEAVLDDVTRVMGRPKMEWLHPDGSRQLAYPRGPMGVKTFMARLGPDGRLQKIENVLAPEFFARITPAMTGDEVLRVLGPPEPSWTRYFGARNELVWEWRYCDVWNQLARFDVLLDNAQMTVRSTMSLRESQIGGCGGDDGASCWCSH
jgi:hypothetical protein